MTISAALALALSLSAAAAPRGPAVVVALGKVLAEKGEGVATKDGGPKVQEAKMLLEKLLARSPHNTGALFNLGVLYADVLKRPQDARPLFQRFLSDAPSDHPARPEAARYASSLADAAPPAPPPPAPAPPAPERQGQQRRHQGTGEGGQIKIQGKAHMRRPRSAASLKYKA